MTYLQLYEICEKYPELSVNRGTADISLKNNILFESKEIYLFRLFGEYRYDKIRIYDKFYLLNDKIHSYSTEISDLRPLNNISEEDIVDYISYALATIKKLHIIIRKNQIQKDFIYDHRTTT